MQKTHTNTNIKHPLKPPLILQIFVVFCKTFFFALLQRIKLDAYV